MANIFPIKDPIIKKISKEITMVIPKRSKDLYFDLIESIVSQQLSGSAARTIFGRFLLLFDNQYPNPKAVISTDDQKMRGAGLSSAKTKYVKALAEFSLHNDISVKYIDNLSNDEIIDYLTQIKGIGKWTVEMVLIFTLQRPDVFPYDDLAIKKGMVELYKIKENGKSLNLKMIEIAEKWRPNRTLATLLIWKHMDRKKLAKP